MEFTMVSTPIVPKARKLHANWTNDAKDAVQMQHVITQTLKKNNII